MRRRIRSAAFPVHRHALPQVALDAGLVALAYFLAYRLRFEGGIPPRYDDLFERTIAFVICGSVVIFALFGLYRHWMRYSSQREYLQIAQAVAAAVAALIGYVAVVQPKLIFTPEGFVSVTVPTGVLVLFGLLLLVFMGGVRYVTHLFYERPLRGYRPRRDARSVLIVGAGDGGRLLLREILRNPDLGLRPVGFVDDDERKQHARIDRGIEVLGTTFELPRVLEDVEPDEVLIAIPSAPGTLRARVVSACRARGVPVRTMPTVFELLLNGAQLVRQVREVRVEDVLGRAPVRMETELTGGYLTGRCVLVTGAGGSIGAELCRQISRVGPSKLVMIDHAEDNLFEIERELVDDRHALNTLAVLADCKDEERMREVFAEHRPTVVFHAAAYKHVGLMESNPVEAVRNNALATRVMARVAGDIGTKVFVLVSTDKAVAAGDGHGRVEGARRMGGRGRRPALRGDGVHGRAVRQRARLVGLGGADLPPPDRERRAGDGHRPGDDALLHDDPGGGAARHPLGVAGAHGGEVFVLEMGDPVKIIDLARDDDPLLPPRARTRTSRSRSSGRGRARSSTRSSSTRTSGRRRRRRPRSCAPRGLRSTPPGSRRRSTRSRCWCWRATPRRWPPRSPSWAPCGPPPAPPRASLPPRSRTRPRRRRPRATGWRPRIAASA